MIIALVHGLKVRGEEVCLRMHCWFVTNTFVYFVPFSLITSLVFPTVFIAMQVLIFSARCNIYISCLCYDVRVRL